MGRILERVANKRRCGALRLGTIRLFFQIQGVRCREGITGGWRGREIFPRIRHRSYQTEGKKDKEKRRFGKRGP